MANEKSGEEPRVHSFRNIGLRAIGVVRSPRTAVEDDYWGGVVATIELDGERFDTDAVAGLEEFSHLEVVFYMDRVSEERIITDARRPRGRMNLPKVGIFAQRAKWRPNRLGVSRCALIAVDGLKLTVEGLDALDGTPVLDVKPYFAEFGPRGEVRQPDWTRKIMERYYSEED